MKSTYGGLFQDPPYLSSHPDPKLTDPYDKKDPIPERFLGKGMQCGHPPPGQTPDVYFDKQYSTLASVDQNNGNPTGYDTNTKEERAMREKKRVSPQEFRYSSYPQKSTGPGSYYGCIQSRPHEYLSDGGSGDKKTQKTNSAVDKTTNPLPNIKTNPPKKGTYGTPGTLLSRESYNENWKEEAERLEREAAKKKKNEESNVGPAFHTSGVSKRYLDELPYTGAPAVYTRYEPAESAKKSTKKETSVKPVSQKPFKGSSSRGCINAFPNTWIDPSTIPESKTKSKSLSYQSTFKPKDGWKPNSFEKTSVVSSCLRQFY